MSQRTAIKMGSSWSHKLLIICFKKPAREMWLGFIVGQSAFLDVFIFLFHFSHESFFDSDLSGLVTFYHSKTLLYRNREAIPHHTCCELKYFNDKSIIKNGEIGFVRKKGWNLTLLRYPVDFPNIFRNCWSKCRDEMNFSQRASPFLIKFFSFFYELVSL